MLAAEVARARHLADDSDVVVAVGPGGSREALQVAPVYRDAQLMQLVPTATSRLLVPLRDWTLVLVPNDSAQGEFIGEHAAATLGARRVAIFYVPDEYGVGLAAGTAAALESRGASILLRAPIQLTLDCTAAGGRESYDALAEQLARRGTPDAVVIAARQVQAGCLTRVLRTRWPNVSVLAGDGTLLDSEFFNRAGPGGEGVLVVAFWHPAGSGEESKEFERRFAARVQRPIRHADAVFYDAVMLAATAIRAEGASRDGVRRYLRSLGVSRPPYPGLTGPVAFTPGFRRPLVMTRVRGTGSELVRVR